MIVLDHRVRFFFFLRALGALWIPNNTLYYSSDRVHRSTRDGSNIIGEQSAKTNIQQQKWRFDESILRFVAATLLLATVASGMK
jgi:hypothetical protein